MSDTSEIRPHEEVLLVAVLKRSLDEITTNELVDHVLTAAVDVPSKPIALDLTAVKFAPSVALGALVKLAKSFEFDGRRLGIICSDSRIRKTIKITRLHEVLEIHDTLDRFLASKKA